MIGTGQQFIIVGERTNVTGSAKFRKLIEAGAYDAWSRENRSKAAPMCST